MSFDSVVSIAYRARRNDAITVSKDGKTNTKYCGLGKYNCFECKPNEMALRGCHKFGNSYRMKGGAFWSIDFGARVDKIYFCPLSMPLEKLCNQVYQALRIKDAGGLEPYFKKPVSKIPHITVVFYNAVLNAERRFNAHKESILNRMRE